jgi:hypothetical protein
MDNLQSGAEHSVNPDGSSSTPTRRCRSGDLAAMLSMSRVFRPGAAKPQRLATQIGRGCERGGIAKSEIIVAETGFGKRTGRRRSPVSRFATLNLEAAAVSAR